MEEREKREKRKKEKDEKLAKLAKLDQLERVKRADALRPLSLCSPTLLSSLGSCTRSDCNIYISIIIGILIYIEVIRQPPIQEICIRFRF